jgi:hypothetical protein
MQKLDPQSPLAAQLRDAVAPAAAGTASWLDVLPQLAAAAGVGDGDDVAPMDTT